MSTMLIAWNATRDSGSFCGDQLCALKTAYLFVQNTADIDKVIVSLSPSNEMHFLLEKFINDPRGDGSIPKCDIVYDTFDPGNWEQRWQAWDKWRDEREIEGRKFDHYRELYLRIHGYTRQNQLCGSERGLCRRNIYSYWFCGQEGSPDELPPSVDWFDDTLIDHPPHKPTRDVYISPHAKTQGNYVFTFDFWAEVASRLVTSGVSVTAGYHGSFAENLNGNPLFKRHWGDHKQWMQEICSHKLVACGNTGTGWLAAACGVPMITMEPHNSVMADHRYRECGLKNIVEVVDGHKLDELGSDMSRVAEYVARRITEEINRCVVMTTGCYDVLHAGHVRHLERARALGTKLIVALNSDESVRQLKGVIQGVPRPVNQQDQRKTVLEALRCVDEVRIFDGLDATELISKIKPDVLACGFGYSQENVVGRGIVEGYGGRVAITCQGDASNELSTTKIVQRMRVADVVEVCRQAGHYSVNPFEKLKLMADQLLSVLNLPGDVADLGTCQGGTGLIMRRLAPDKHLHLFDTWAGNPYDDPLCHHKKGEWATSLEDCSKLVGNGDLTHYWQGVFPGYMVHSDNIGIDQLCFVYIDSDTYQSVKDSIEFFWPRMVTGGKMLFDDYSWEPCAGVKKAVDEVFAPEQRQVVEQHHTCIVVKQ